MNIDFNKMQGLVPAIVQDAAIGRDPDAWLHE